MWFALQAIVIKNFVMLFRLFVGSSPYDTDLLRALEARQGKL